MVSEYLEVNARVVMFLCGPLQSGPDHVHYNQYNSQPDKYYAGDVCRLLGTFPAFVVGSAGVTSHTICAESALVTLRTGTERVIVGRYHA